MTEKTTDHSDADRRRVLIQAIHEAFDNVVYPGDLCLTGTTQGDDPVLLIEEFTGRSDWRTLDSDFLNQAPDGFASALSLFSDEAFRFYLPAYLISDIKGELVEVNLIFHLCFFLKDSKKNEPVNPRLYGPKTWLEFEKEQFDLFDQTQARVIVEFLRFKLHFDNPNVLDEREIEQGLRNYWLARCS